MKTKKVIGAAIASVLALSFGAAGGLVACNKVNEPTLDDKALEAEVIADYTKTADDRSETFASGSKGFSWENGEPFNVWWNPQNVSYDNNKLSLSLSEMTTKEKVWDATTETNVDCLADYYGGEERSNHYYGYGDYEVRMKPSKVAGTASTFFVCTGEYDVHYDTGKKNPHDEVDIEFLGQDTTKVQFNYFANDVGGHEFMYDLGFDASEEFHNYGFRWTAEYIVWFVDGKPVYKVNAADRKDGEPWAVTPGRIIMNYWCGTERAQEWMGEFKDDYSGHAEYEWVKVSAKAENDPNIDPTPVPPGPSIEVPTSGWENIDYSSFGGWSGYTISTENGINISHSEAKTNWACEGMSLSSSYSWVKFNVKNNADSAADIRIDVKKEGGTNGVEDVVSECEGVTYNSTDSAIMLHLAAGESADVAAKIKEQVVDQFVVFLNSMSSGMSTAGDITISELKGIPSDIHDEPVEEDEGLKFGDKYVKFTGSSYNITYNDAQTEMTVAYADIKGNAYTNINGNFSEVIKTDDNVFSVKIKNNGADTAKIRLDIDCTAGEGTTYTQGGSTEGKNNFCNIKKVVTGAADMGNDYDWQGGDWVKIAAGETATVKIYFTTGVGAKGVTMFVDSSTYDDESNHTGSILFSEMGFSKEELLSITFNANKPNEAEEDVAGLPAAITDIVGGDTVSAPAAPTLEGYTFGGWFTDAECTEGNAYTFGATTASATLYAKWTPGEEEEEQGETISLNGYYAWGKYTASGNSEGSVKVSHTVVLDSDDDGAGLDLAKKYSKLTFKVKNTGSAACKVKVNTRDDSSTHTAITSAKIGANAVSGDLENDWGFEFDLAQGDEVVIELVLDVTKTANKFNVSLNPNGSGIEAGEITISELKGVVASSEE